MLTNKLPPLPESWVDRIFAKLTLVYGRAFLSQYEGIDMHLVKSDWAQELAWYQQAPEHIAFALENLPADRPPNVLQFRSICRRMPTPAYKALPAPKSDPELAKRILAELREKMKAPQPLKGANDDDTT